MMLRPQPDCRHFEIVRHNFALQSYIVIQS